MNNPSALVSIIVPAYNVERYLKDCADSLLRQTYTNIEIVIVNDGSTDGTRRVADSIRKQDSRVRVVHTPNMGVSCARNTGLEVARGDLICFVDGDDTIFSNSIELMVTVLQKYCADVATFKLQLVKSTSSQEMVARAGRYELAVSGNEALEKLLFGRDILNSPCAKLYTKKLLNGLLFFDKLAYGEDMLFNFHALQRANNVVITDTIVYDYLQRAGSAMRSSFNVKRLDSYRAALYMDAEIRKVNDTNLNEAMLCKLFTEAISVASTIPYKKRSSIETYKEYVKIVREHSGTILASSNATRKNRIFAAVAFVNIELVIAIIKLKNAARSVM